MDTGEYKETRDIKSTRNKCMKDEFKDERD